MPGWRIRPDSDLHRITGPSLSRARHVIKPTTTSRIANDDILRELPLMLEEIVAMFPVRISIIALLPAPAERRFGFQLAGSFQSCDTTSRG